MFKLILISLVFYTNGLGTLTGDIVRTEYNLYMEEEDCRTNGKWIAKYTDTVIGWECKRMNE